MRPIVITGVVGNSAPIPLDVYSTASNVAAIFNTSGAPALQMTLDDVYNTANINWVAAPAAGAGGVYVIPQGVRALRGTGMVAADILTVSEQGIR